MTTIRAHLVGAAILAALPSLAFSQDVKTADLAVRIVQGPATTTLPDSSGTLIFEVTNFGPDIAGPTPVGIDNLAVSTNEVPFWQSIGSAVHFTRSALADCHRFTWAVISPGPGQQSMAGYLAEFNALAPGESATCVIDYHVNPSLAVEPFRSSVGAQLVIPWSAFGVYIDDPNPSNDEFNLVFNLVASPIPALSSVGAVMMAMGMLVAFLWVQRRRGRTRRG